MYVTTVTHLGRLWPVKFALEEIVTSEVGVPGFRITQWIEVARREVLRA